jgi:hypothetical protein
MRKRPFLVLLAPFLLTACGGDDNNDWVPTGPTANFQVVNASPDAPSLSVIVDGQDWFDGLYYGQGTGELPLPAGSHMVSVQAQTPGGWVTVIQPTSIDFLQNNDYVLVAEGPYATMSPAVFSHPLSVVASTATRVQFVQADPDAAAVAVYLTAPAADLSSSAPLGTGSLAFMGATGPNDVPSGQYEIRITAAGTTTPVLFDSGTITLTGGTDLLLTALQNPGPGPSTIALGVVDAYGDTSKLFDTATPAMLRVVNASPDSSPLDFFSNGNSGTPLVPGLAFEGFTAYLPLTPGAFNFAVTPASNMAQVLATTPLTLNGGSELTLYALGTLANIGLQLTWDDLRRIAPAAKLRIIQGSPGASVVDLYLTAPGASIGSIPPTYAAVPLGGDTWYQQFAAGSYALTVTAAGSKTPLIGPTTLNVVNTGIYTVVTRDAPGGGAPYGLILMDDFAP